MLVQNLFNGLCVLALAYCFFAYTNREGIELPRPREGYSFVPNETQKLIAEAGKEAARVLAAKAQPGQLAAGAASTALTQLGVALKEGDEALGATIHYVHQYHRLAAASASTQQQQQPEAMPPVQVHVFLAADNGTYSGMHELYYITAAMRYSTPIHIEGCRSALFGFLEKPRRDPLTWSVQNTQQRNTSDGSSAGLRKVLVLAVTTGIYVTSSAACTAAVMELPMFAVQSVTLIGTAGVSPVVGGGGWNPQTTAVHGSAVSLKREKNTNPICQRPWAAEAEKIALGSVCVTYAALLQECGHCVEENDVTTLCSRPRCSIHNSTTFFGPCSFRHPISSFAEQMKGAMFRKSFPTPPAIVQEAMQAFWEVNEAVPAYARSAEEVAKRAKARRQGKGKRVLAAEIVDEDPDAVLSYNRVAPKTPTLLNCAEVATSQILAGPRSDVLCRQYTEALFDGLYAASDLSCVQAMEGMGVLHVLTREYPHVPVAIVRGASNYDMFPLSRHVHLLDRTPNLNNVVRDEWFVSWDQKEHYVSDEVFHRFTKASYRYSIETASAVVLNYFLSADTVLPGMA